jgi:hypothetical protein
MSFKCLVWAAISESGFYFVLSFLGMRSSGPSLVQCRRLFVSYLIFFISRDAVLWPIVGTV